MTFSEDEINALPSRPQGHTWCRFCGWKPDGHKCSVVSAPAEVEAAFLAACEAVSPESPATLVRPAADTPADSWAWYSGRFVWTLPGGWTIEVFNDCGEWDYLEVVTTPTGDAWHFSFEPADGRALTPAMEDWKPTDGRGWPHIRDCCPDDRVVRFE